MKLSRIFFGEPFYDALAPVSEEVIAATLEQIAGLWIDDVGGETTAVANQLAAQGEDIVDNSTDNRRLRVLIQATGDPTSANFQLEYRKVGDVDWIVIE